jgi:very-short-patch-repair endonuclease
VNRRQLLALGATAKAVKAALRTGRLLSDPNFRGVYAVARPATTVEGRFMAAVLSCDDATLAASSGATNWNLLPDRPGDPVHLSSVTWLKPTPARQVHRLRTPLHQQDRCLRHNIPTTTVPRLVLDLAEMAPQDLETVLNEAHYLYGLNLWTVEQAASRAPGRHALKPIRRLLAAYDDGTSWTRTEIERQLKRIAKTAGLPPPSMNHPYKRFQIDAAWPELKLAVELDGRRAHSTPQNFERDRQKQNALILDGWTVLRFTTNQLKHHATRVATELKRAYENHPLRRNHTQSRTHDTTIDPSPST